MVLEVRGGRDEELKSEVLSHGQRPGLVFRDSKLAINAEGQAVNECYRPSKSCSDECRIPPVALLGDGPPRQP
jgi:hypothetical protein